MRASWRERRSAASSTLAGMATLHLSPLTVLAIVSDVAYGSQSYLQELSTELKQAGIIDEDTTIDHAADLLEAIRNTSASTAGALELPPLSVEGLRETIQQTQRAAQGIDPTRLLPQAEMQQLWNQMHEMADREGVGLLDISSTMTLFVIDKVGRVGHGALSSVKVAGNMFDRHIFDHYRQGLTEIQDKGLYSTLSVASQPYISAVWTNFSSDRETINEILLLVAEPNVVLEMAVLGVRVPRWHTAVANHLGNCLPPAFDVGIASQRKRSDLRVAMAFNTTSIEDRRDVLRVGNVAMRLIV